MMMGLITVGSAYDSWLAVPDAALRVPPLEPPGAELCGQLYVQFGKRRMANGEWQMANGKWRMVNGEWRMKNGEWRCS